MWSSLYESAWHHPGVAWVALGLGALAFASRLRFLGAYLVLFGVALGADALAGAPFIRLPAPVGTVLSVVFVIAGDLRLFVVVERCTSKRGLNARAVGLAVASALIVPLASTAARLAIPAVAANERVQYLVYEAMFVVLALTWRLALLPARLRDAKPEVRRWALLVTTFVLAQYALWVTADVLILTGHDVGFGLRLVPNTLYYALFLPFVYAAAPPSERSFGAAGLC